MATAPENRQPKAAKKRFTVEFHDRHIGPDPRSRGDETTADFTIAPCLVRRTRLELALERLEHLRRFVAYATLDALELRIAHVHDYRLCRRFAAPFLAVSTIRRARGESWGLARLSSLAR